MFASATICIITEMLTHVIR